MKSSSHYEEIWEKGRPCDFRFRRAPKEQSWSYMTQVDQRMRSNSVTTQEDHLESTPLEKKTCKKSNSASDDRELRQRGSDQDEVPRSLAAFLAHHEAAR